MGVRTLDDTTVLEGVVSAEDGEALLELLRDAPRRRVDLAACTHVHAASLQVLLALRPALVAAPADPWLCAALRSLEAA